MLRRSLAVAALVVFALAASLAGYQSAIAQGPGGSRGPGGPGGPGGMRSGGMSPFGAPDSFAADRDSLIKLTMERIAGREKDPAEQVFKNIKVLKGVPAEQLLRRMDGFGRSLGVGCNHCHIENHWADEDKPAKRICREMIEMMPALNDTLLARVTLDRPDDHPHVGCFTCHRGHANPNWGMPRRGQGGPGGQGGMGGQRPDGDRH